jgi:hypothetical protein
MDIYEIMADRVKILFFITHHTLSADHARMTLGSLGLSKDPMKFDRMYIYNTHPEELSNEFLLTLTQEYNLGSFIKDIKLFPGAYPINKTLASDIIAIQSYCINHYKLRDAIWLLKSDCVVSVNLANELMKVDKLNSFVLTPPFICAKKRVTNDEINEYCKKPLVVLSDHETFFNEDAYGTPENDFKNRPGESPKDFNIKFISCTVKRDFSCHYLTLDNLIVVSKREQNWGGVWFQNVSDKWIGTYRGFVVHKYHSIESPNRPNPREGTIEDYLLS